MGLLGGGELLLLHPPSWPRQPQVQQGWGTWGEEHLGSLQNRLGQPQPPPHTHSHPASGPAFLLKRGWGASQGKHNQPSAAAPVPGSKAGAGKASSSGALRAAPGYSWSPSAPEAPGRGRSSSCLVQPGTAAGNVPLAPPSSGERFPRGDTAEVGKRGQGGAWPGGPDGGHPGTWTHKRCPRLGLSSAQVWTRPSDAGFLGGVPPLNLTARPKPSHSANSIVAPLQQTGEVARVSKPSHKKGTNSSTTPPD